MTVKETFVTCERRFKNIIAQSAGWYWRIQPNATLENLSRPALGHTQPPMQWVPGPYRG